MKPFVISFGDWCDRTGPFYRCFFRIKKGGLSFPISITLTDLCAAVLGLSEERVKELLPEIGLEYVLRKLTAGDYPGTSTTKFQDIALNSYEQVDLDKYSEKYCRFQAKSDSGLVCKVRSQADPRKGKISQPLCEQCTLPDSRFLCSHLSHPLVVSQGTGRVVEDALCEKGQNPSNASQCIPCDKDCWELIYEPSKPASAIPSDLAERVADEIDFLNLAFKEIYCTKILPINNARSISDLYSYCQDAEEFMAKVAVLADLINQLSVLQLLPEEERGKVKGTINALNLFTERNYPGQGEDLLRNLRLVCVIRNSFPIHSRTERLLTSFDSLDIDYPPENWHLAWEKVLCAFWLSLKQLRRLVMMGKRVAS